MSILTFSAPALVALSLSAWLTWRFCKPSSLFHILDNPNERSLHINPTPRSGGIAILAGLLIGGALIGVPNRTALYAWFLAALVPVAIMSYLDDRAGVPVLLRLLTHFVGAGLLVFGISLAFQNELSSGKELSWMSWFSFLMVLSCVVWMINLYNFMDGMDGFAGGMTAIGFGFLAMMGLFAGNFQFAQTSFMVAGSAIGFLFFNFPPARIFMGDVGSSALGLLAAAFSLWGVSDGVFPLWIAILIFSPFIADASVTLVKRLSCGEKIWQAHKTHYYQKLVQAGLGHRKTVLIEYVIMIGCGITAMLGLRATATIQVVMFTGWIIFYIIFFTWISRYASRKHHDPA